MMAPSTELASLYFSFPVMKSQIPKKEQLLGNIQRDNVFCPPMQLLVTTTASCAEVLMLRLSIVNSCLSMWCSFSKM